MASSVAGQEVAVGHDRVPGPELVLQEDAVMEEGITLKDLLGLVAGGGLVDDEGAAVVGERAGEDEPALLAQAGEVLAVDRTKGLDLVPVLKVLDDRGEFH